LILFGFIEYIDLVMHWRRNIGAKSYSGNRNSKLIRIETIDATEMSIQIGYEKILNEKESKETEMRCEYEREYKIYIYSH